MSHLHRILWAAIQAVPLLTGAATLAAGQAPAQAAALPHVATSTRHQQPPRPRMHAQAHGPRARAQVRGPRMS